MQPVLATIHTYSHSNIPTVLAFPSEQNTNLVTENGSNVYLVRTPLLNFSFKFSLVVKGLISDVDIIF